MEAGPKQGAASGIGQTGTSIPGQGQGQGQGPQEPSAEAGPFEEGVLLTRVHVPELCISKCLQFPRDQLVWDVKQQCLASLPKVISYLLLFMLNMPFWLQRARICLRNRSDYYIM